MEEAANRGYFAQKFKADGISVIYERAMYRIQTWAKDQKIVKVGGVTVEMLDKWRRDWRQEAKKEIQQKKSLNKAALDRIF